MTGATSHPDAVRAQSARRPDPGGRVPAPAAPKTRPAGAAPAFRIGALDADDRVQGRAALAAAARVGGPPDPTGDLGEVALDRWERGRRDDAPTIELGWADVLDVVNPLQHIPVVSSIYRSITGDEISAPARVAGGALFGGPVGFVSGIANSIVAEVSGGDVGETALAALLHGGEAPVGEPAPTTAVAALEAAPAAAPIGFAAVSDPLADLDGAPESGPDPGPRPAPEAAPEGASAPGAPGLEGAAALAALARDLRGRAAPVAAAPVERVVAAPVAARAAPAAEPGPADFPARMLDALDKYRALMRARTREGEKPGRAVDGTY